MFAGMVRRFPHIFGAILVLLFFVGPLLLRSKLSFEPYPAVLLPSGAQQVNIDDNRIEYAIWKVYGFEEKEQSWKELDPADFLGTIRIHYFQAIVQNEFGLKESRSDKKRYKNPLISWFRENVYLPHTTVSEGARQETRQWLASRLRNLGYAPDSLKAQWVSFTRVCSTGALESRKVVYERVFELE